MALNKVLLIGNVGRDPEVRHLEGGAAVANFSLATSERYKDRNGETREATEWHTIVAWRQLADLAEKYIRKGSQIYVEGRIRSRSWDDQSGVKRTTVEILADSIQLLGVKGTVPTSPGQFPSSSAAPAQAVYTEPRPVVPVAPTAPVASPFDEDDADDLPF
jgi:single-strand DNA-binding protein